MAEYAVSLEQTAGHTEIVNADSPEEAAEIAENIGVSSLCHHCSGHVELDAGNWEVKNVYNLSESRERTRNLHFTEPYGSRSSENSTPDSGSSV